jgi:hypothetical protein
MPPTRPEEFTDKIAKRKKKTSAFQAPDKKKLSRKPVESAVQYSIVERDHGMPGYYFRKALLSST